jgi:septal ring factor EnvC (AmiA/AmiB activator)
MPTDNQDPQKAPPTAAELALAQREQTIRYLHADIATLNNRVNDLWEQLQASEDGSGLAAIRGLLAEKDARLSALSGLCDLQEARIAELLALVPAIEPSPDTERPSDADTSATE